MTRKLKAHFRQFAVGSLIAALGASAYVIAAVSFSDFLPATTISSAEMNAKLNALKNAVIATPVTVVRTSSVGIGTFGFVQVDCPAGYYAVGGGVDTFNVFSMQVTSSGPSIGGTRMLSTADGTYATPLPTGWFGGVVNNSMVASTFTVGVICAPE